MGEHGRPLRRTRLLYVLAASHSGSTLLAMLLGTHPEICTVGELKATSLGDVAQYRCSCRKFLRQCEFWSGVTAEVNGQGLGFDITGGETDVRTVASGYARWLLRPLHRGPALEIARDLALGLSPCWRVHRRRFEALDAALPQAICLRTGRSVIVDSSKAGLRLKYLLRNPALDVRVIRLIRDGRAVALTYMDPARFADASDVHLRGGGAGAARDAERLDMPAAAHEWRRSNEEAETIVRRLDPSRWTIVRYEDLCLDTEGTLRHLFAFAGVDPLCPRPGLRAVEHHVIGNGMRFDSSSEIHLDERWRDTLAANELRLFDALAGPLNRRLGYGSPGRLETGRVRPTAA